MDLGDIPDRRREVQQGRAAVRPADGPVHRCGGLGRRLFASFGAELVNAKGDVTVKSDNVREAWNTLSGWRRICRATFGSWDDASNNRALISGKSALIFNPPSAWAVAVRDNPEVGSKCWTHPGPGRREGPLPAYLPYFWGIWTFGKNKTAAKELIEWPQRARAGRAALHRLARLRHAAVPEHEQLPGVADRGSAEGHGRNYQIKPEHKATPWIAAYPAPPEVAVQIYNQATMTKMIARMAQGGDSIDKAIDWAQGELEGFTR